ncbi:T9SS type A sorting domain-containing protein [Flavobacterium ginsenosidimutans]|uniref:T9SS type A sorting domain-containing protein n=1 Tax=Flavobacterium ginsenosidimutans TaxID=687844 RepID=UPI0013A651DB|nr:T9SS type A sorting domain-containing protein [Flavobacterium ginsenosidimutans]KAF2335430.1 T9SS type A sorting domain-containing protein [Flavobacterium ginsenosidimutans]
MKKILLGAIICFINLVQAQTVTTIAGSSRGFANASGLAAKFNQPDGICADSKGNLYVADWANYMIRKITPDGVVSTFAGSTYGFSDGIGIEAKFREPRGICIDSNDNIYVTDPEDDKIRKITSDGTVSTYVEIESPIGICIDSKGYLYVSDTNVSRINKVAPDGTISIFAGSDQGLANGAGPEARFYNPFGMCMDSAGNLYVADTNNNNIRKITPDAVVTIFAGSPTGDTGSTNGVGTNAKFNYPYGIVIDENNILYVTDNGYNKIRKITPDGTVSNYAGSSFGFIGDSDGIGSDAEFYNPSGICILKSGVMYVADQGNHRIRKINTTLGVDYNEVSNLPIALFPNPTSDVLNVVSNSSLIGSKIIITDVSGKTLHTQEVSDPIVLFNLRDYNKGLYFLTLLKDNSRETHKIIVN